MTDIPQFILWKLTWDTVKGKYAKHPIHPQNPNIAVDASKSVNWMTYDLSKQWSDYLNATAATDSVKYSHGFYFTATCGYWFLDVDQAQVDGVMTPVATHLSSLLSDCCFEWSSSGTGYHIFGSGELSRARQIKPAGTGLELYTEGRGVAFGLTDEATGCADNGMNELVIPTYFAPVAGRVIAGNEDFNEPREDWYCTANDEELLQRMLRSGSVESKFNVSKPIFADYWEARMDMLNSYYKHDRSAIDAGLAAHLAFWTGCHSPRMKKFMEMSALVRDKWNREDYLDRTIKAACIAQDNVLQDKKTVEMLDVVEAMQVEDDQLSTILNANEQIKLFKDCVYVTSIHAIYKPLKSGEFRTLSSEQFNAIFGKYTFKLNLRNEASSYSKKAFEAFLKSQICDFPKVDDIRFDPTQNPKAVFNHNGNRYLNSYDPIHIDRCKGDVSYFTELVHKNFPNGDDAEILTSWMAACVQYPGHKFMWAPVLQGGQGIGKTTITECLKHAVGRQFVVTPKASELGAKFNSWIERALLVVINEMKQDRESEGEIKKLVTDRDVIIEQKGRDSYMAINYANFIFTLNDKSDFKKVRGDRRFCVMYSALQDTDDIVRAGMTEGYFNKIQHWLNNDAGYAKVTEYLATYDVPERFNPAKSCVRAPDSSSEAEVYQNSQHKIESTLREAVNDELKGFKGGWISSKCALDLFDNKFDARILRKHLLNMGYKLHPNLFEGRTNNVLIEEGRKIRLWCDKVIIEVTKELQGQQITDAYRKAQYE